MIESWQTGSYIDVLRNRNNIEIEVLHHDYGG